MQASKRAKPKLHLLCYIFQRHNTKAVLPCRLWVCHVLCNCTSFRHGSLLCLSSRFIHSLRLPDPFVPHFPWASLITFISAAFNPPATNNLARLHSRSGCGQQALIFSCALPLLKNKPTCCPCVVHRVA